MTDFERKWLVTDLQSTSNKLQEALSRETNALTEDWRKSLLYFKHEIDRLVIYLLERRR